MPAPKVVIEYRKTKPDYDTTFVPSIETSVFGPFESESDAEQFINTYETEPGILYPKGKVQQFTQDLRFKIVPMDHPRHALLTPPQT